MTVTMKAKLKRILFFMTSKEFSGQLNNLRKEDIITLNIVIKKRLKHTEPCLTKLWKMVK